MKLDGDSMKKMFVAHGEKIAFGVFGVIALVLMVMGFIGKTTATEQQTPGKITEAAIEEGSL